MRLVDAYRQRRRASVSSEWGMAMGSVRVKGSSRRRAIGVAVLTSEWISGRLQAELWQGLRHDEHEGIVEAVSLTPPLDAG